MIFLEADEIARCLSQIHYQNGYWLLGASGSIRELLQHNPGMITFQRLLG